MPGLDTDAVEALLEDPTISDKLFKRMSKRLRKLAEVTK